MRVSIERGYHAPIQELMGRLQTSDGCDLYLI